MSSRNKTGCMNIKPGKISYKILQWIQEHEGTNALKNTTGHIIASRIAALDDVPNGELTIEQTFSKMVKCNIVYRDQHYKSIYSDYRINYWHKSIPSDILDNAPVSVKRVMAERIDEMTQDQYMDEQGCVVTPGAVEKTEDPFNEDVSNGNTTPADAMCKIMDNFATSAISHEDEEEPGTFDNPIVEDQAPCGEDTATVPLKVTKSDDGKQITVNLSLVINL